MSLPDKAIVSPLPDQQYFNTLSLGRKTMGAYARGEVSHPNFDHAGYRGFDSKTAHMLYVLALKAQQISNTEAIYGKTFGGEGFFQDHQHVPAKEWLVGNGAIPTYLLFDLTSTAGCTSMVIYMDMAPEGTDRPTQPREITFIAPSYSTNDQPKAVIMVRAPAGLTVYDLRHGTSRLFNIDDGGQLSEIQDVDHGTNHSEPRKLTAGILEVEVKPILDRITIAAGR
jgi:hypothetical protein